jgi:hypothetical protein
MHPKLRDRSPTSRRGRVVAIALVVLVTAAGCVRPARDDPDPPRRDADTIADAAIGQRLTITAGVDRRLSDRSFIVRDADLPDDGLLVVTLAPTHVWYPVLVTVTGTVRMFHPADFAWLRLSERSRYTAFDARKVLLADEVKVWAPDDPRSST